MLHFRALGGEGSRIPAHDVFGVTIVPLRIEDILPTDSFKYFLGNIHWLDALTPPLEKHLQEVAAKVKAILSTGSVSCREHPSPPCQ